MAQTIKLTSGASTNAPTNDTLFVSANTSGAIVKHSLEQIGTTLRNDSLLGKMIKIWSATDLFFATSDRSQTSSSIKHVSEFAYSSTETLFAPDTGLRSLVLWDGEKFLEIGYDIGSVTKFANTTAAYNADGTAAWSAISSSTDYASSRTDSTTAVGYCYNYSQTYYNRISGSSTTTITGWRLPSRKELAAILRNIHHIDNVRSLLLGKSKWKHNQDGVFCLTETSNTANIYTGLIGYQKMYSSKSKTETSSTYNCVIPVRSY